jgi:hypothetical protein
MAKQIEFALSMGADTSDRLRDGAKELGASEAELLSIDRLEAGRGTSIDVERLAPLAMALGIPWQEMWERMLPKGDA